MIKKDNFDLSRYQKGTIDAIKSANTKKIIHSLPYIRPFFMLYYNKDIFDKFAAPYPKDRNLMMGAFPALETGNLGMDVNTFLRTYGAQMNALIDGANSK